MKQIKRLITTALLMLLGLIAFSQKDTATQKEDSLVCIPKSAAQKIAAELVQKDGLMQQIELYKKNELVYTSLLNSKDTTILMFKKINTNYMLNEIDYRAKINVLNNEKEYAESQSKKLKFKNSIYQVAIIALTTLYILKK